MAEIKSTLELVMERTRHLSLTDEERQEQALSDFRKNLSGIMRKFLDGAFNHERFRSELEALESNSGIKAGGTLVDVAGDFLVLGEGNDRVLRCLEESLGLDLEPVAHILDEYAEAVRFESERRSFDFKKDLLEKRGIQGSAVQVNLDADDSWKSFKEVLEKQYAQSLFQELTRLKSTIA